MLIDEKTPQTKPGWAALAKALLDQAALPGEDLAGQLPAVFASHGALEPLEHRGHGAAVVFKLFGAIVDVDPCAPADVLVVGAFICVLEAAPSADVVDKNDVEIRPSRRDRFNQLFQGFPAFDPQPALSFIGVSADDLHAAPCSVGLDCCRLVFSRVALMIGGHAHVLVRPEKRRTFTCSV